MKHERKDRVYEYARRITVYISTVLALCLVTNGDIESAHASSSDGNQIQSEMMDFDDFMDALIFEIPYAQQAIAGCAFGNDFSRRLGSGNARNRIPTRYRLAFYPLSAYKARFRWLANEIQSEITSKKLMETWLRNVAEVESIKDEVFVLFCIEVFLATLTDYALGNKPLDDTTQEELNYSNIRAKIEWSIPSLVGIDYAEETFALGIYRTPLVRIKEYLDDLTEFGLEEFYRAYFDYYVQSYGVILSFGENLSFYLQNTKITKAFVEFGRLLVHMSDLIDRIPVTDGTAASIPRDLASKCAARCDRRALLYDVFYSLKQTNGSTALSKQKADELLGLSPHEVRRLIGKEALRNYSRSITERLKSE